MRMYRNHKLEQSGGVYEYVSIVQRSLRGEYVRFKDAAYFESANVCANRTVNSPAHLLIERTKGQQLTTENVRKFFEPVDESGP